MVILGKRQDTGSASSQGGKARVTGRRFHSADEEEGECIRGSSKGKGSRDGRDYSDEKG